MKKLTLFTATMIIVQIAFSQWEWQNPLPQGNAIHSLSFIDENNGWAVGPRTILHTEDGGVTWALQERENADSYGDLKFMDVCFTDELHGWIVGGEGAVFRLYTEDGGKTWNENLSKKESKLPAQNTDVFFIDQQSGWILGWSASMGSTYILRTADGGKNWDSHNVYELNGWHGGLFFVDNMEGWVVWGSKILHTIDGGIQWEVQYSDDTANLYDVYFTDADHGWAVGKDGRVMITNDGGTLWESTTIENLSVIDINAVSFIDIDVGWICGISDSGGFVLKTTDGGYNWEWQTFGEEPLPIFDLVSIPGSIVITAGENGEMYKTVENGDSWFKLSSNFTNCNFNDVFFTDPNKGWAAGRIEGETITPAIFHTNDGGISWTEQELLMNGPGRIHKIFFTDSLHGWATGIQLTLSNFNLYGTVDGGENWELQTSSSDEMMDLCFVNNSIGWRVGEKGAIQKTTDGGWNWTDQNSGTDKNLYSLVFIDEENGWIAGDSTILHSSDGGQTWAAQSAGEYAWSHIFFLDEQHGWVTHPYGRTMRTLDGGQTWEETFDFGFYEIVFFDTANGWGRYTTFTGGASDPPFTNIYKTSDGGLSWDPQSIPALIEGGFCFTDIDHGWAVSGKGKILHINNTGSSGFEENSSCNAMNAIHCYPNPFTKKTTIEYELTIPTTVQITLYDYMGRQVRSIERHQGQGKQQVVWNAEGLPAGVYFCVFKTDSALHAVKLIKR